MIVLHVLLMSSYALKISVFRMKKIIIIIGVNISYVQRASTSPNARLQPSILV